MKQNKLFLFIVVSLFLAFSLTIYFGAFQIYDNERKWRYENVNAAMLSTAAGIKDSFTHSQNDLSFIQEFPSFKIFVDNFEETRDKSEVTQILFVFAMNYKHYSQIGIIDSSGQEIIRVENGGSGLSTIVEESKLQNERDKEYFRETMKLVAGQTYLQEIGLNIGQEKVTGSNTPVLRLATPVFDSQGEKKGVLYLEQHISMMFESLPVNMFLQTGAGSLISSTGNGSIDISKSSFDFKASEGEIEIAHLQAIHYSTVEFLPGEKWYIGAYHDHSFLQDGIHRLIITSVGLLFFSFGLLLAVSLINFARYKNLIDSHRAIISSLAGLTEWRDPDTGRHLERTRDYAVLLAKQLRSNNKYRKNITRGFIEDLYFAAPLHDMGKVGIKDSILLKEGKLTAKEYEEIKEHVRIGKQLLQDVIDKYGLKDPVLVMSRNICAYHHEKYNGKGYLEGLKDGEIPLEARIFTLADAYDAIRSKRPYKPELSHEEAVRRIKTDSGEHFDADVVDAFLICASEFGRISELVS